MQVYCPVASSTIALSLFSWLSLPASNQQQNHLFIASARLHDFTAQNPLQGLPAILGTKPKVLTMASKAYRMEPASFSHLCPSMFLPQSLCTWCLFCLECPSPTIHLTFAITSFRSLTTITLLEGAFLSKPPPIYHSLFSYPAPLFFPYIVSGILSCTYILCSCCLWYSCLCYSTGSTTSSHYSFRAWSSSSTCLLNVWI